ncbi:hypothetical protein PILCRDRAFT_814421 [Piloderma croceum F 1598]|uniref:Uncharacterized protein n=1 Tax=Piloderma croceum (strain F 1598) TaxID=765440 RepID=A0A0C3GAR7_PILCF|nr:hypothetical protein PILCRDRAFT_814421 [Piloderma croceum F 1598]
MKYSIYGNEYGGNLYPSKYSKKDEELPKDVCRLYIHRGLPSNNRRPTGMISIRSVRRFHSLEAKR